MRILPDGYYLVTPIAGSKWNPIAVQVHEGQEEYLCLNFGCFHGPSSMQDTRYYDEVVLEGGEIKPITKDQFDMLVRVLAC